MDRRHHTAFLKTRLYSSCAPSPGGRQKSPTNRGNIKKLRNEIMQPNSSMDPGQISIQKLKKAREMVTITKQRRHVFLVLTKEILDVSATI